MNCCGILIVVIVVIIFAMFICFCPTGKHGRVSGGHEVKLGDHETLHIENYKELKKTLKEMNTTWDKKTVRAEADRIVDEIIAEMDNTLGYHQKAAFIDEEIIKKIESIRKGISK